MSLFKKKAGGTLFGNLMRVGAQRLTGGIMGQGADMIPAGGQTPQDSILQTASGVGAAVQALQNSQNSATMVEQKMSSGAAGQWVKDNILLVLGAMGLVYLIYKKRI